MERVALATANLLDQSYDVEIFCIGGSQADRRVYPAAQLLGSPLRGWRRTLSIWRLWRLARTLQTDTVVLAGVWVALPWLVLSNTRKFKSVVWEHSLLNRRASSSIQMKILAAGARILYRRSTTIVAVSAPLKRDIAKLTGVNVAVIPNPVDTPADNELIRSMPDDDGTLIRLVTVGSLTPVKSQETLIRALKLLDDRFVLTIAGTGPLEAMLRNLARDLGLEERVVFAGFLEEPRLREVLRSAHLLVHCSHVETFGLVYAEAANAGLPVVSTESDVAHEMIPYFVPGWVCNSDPSSLAEEISKRANEPPSTDELLEAAGRRRAAFASESVRKKWQQTIESL
ncbi:glycosyltransferase [Paenarthrobacter sp. NPDC089316]